MLIAFLIFFHPTCKSENIFYTSEYNCYHTYLCIFYSGAVWVWIQLVEDLNEEGKYCGFFDMILRVI